METANTKVTIVKTFRDKGNFALIHREGSEVAFSVERASELERLGLVAIKKPETPQAPETPAAGTEGIPAIETPETPEATGIVAIDLTQNAQKVAADVGQCSNMEELNSALVAEVNAKNRKSVVEALNARISVCTLS